jgi:uncharacterized protein
MRQQQAVGKILVQIIRGYQSVSKYTPSVCRFTPSCSEYAVQAITIHGAGQGVWLGFCRICRCHPFHPGGFDPVPEAIETQAAEKTIDCTEGLIP